MGIVKNNKNILAIYRGDKKITSVFKNNLKIFEIKNHPSYIKSAFAYDSFTEDGVVDIITNIKHNYGLYTYEDFNFSKKDHYNTIYQIGSYRSLETNSTKEPILKDYKSILIKCNNILTNTFELFDYTQKVTTKYESITFSNIKFQYITQMYYYNDLGLTDENKNIVQYIYIDFNCESEQSKILFLNQNFDILLEKNLDTFNLSEEEDVGSFNSLLHISFGNYNSSSRPIDFYYQCYCDKALSIDEIKEIDEYMMNR